MGSASAHRHGHRLQVVGLDGDHDVTGAGGTDGSAAALEGAVPIREEVLLGARLGAAERLEHAGAFDLHDDRAVGVRMDGAGRVDERDRDVDEVVVVGGDLFAVDLDGQPGRRWR